MSEMSRRCSAAICSSSAAATAVSSRRKYVLICDVYCRFSNRSRSVRWLRLIWDLMLAMRANAAGTTAAGAYYSAPLGFAALTPYRRQHRDLLGGHGPVSGGGPHPRGGRRGLLRDQRRGVGVHARVPDPEPGPRAGRRRGAVERV